MSSFFQSLSAAFANFNSSPRRPRRDESQRPIHQHRRSSRSQQRAHSPSPRRRRSPPSPTAGPPRHRRKGRTEIPLSLRDERNHQLDLSFEPRRDFATSQLNQSYANELPLAPEFAALRERLRHLPVSSLATSGSSARPGDFAQMLNDNTEEEARLFGGIRRPKNAVEIKPGASRPNRLKPGASAAFQPTDRISYARQSGPVRASGKNRNSDSFAGNYRLLEDAHDFRDSDRPNKRRRQESSRPVDLHHEEPAGSVASEVSTSARRSSRFSPGSNRSATASRIRDRPVVSEFRGVEAMLEYRHDPHQRARLPSNASSIDEAFTLGAAAQRRSSGSFVEYADNHHAQRILDSSKPKRLPLETIQISALENDEADSTQWQIGPQPLTPLKRPQDAPDIDDSPDELQGEVTTQHTPKHLAKRHGKAEETIKQSPSRKRSPSDIEPTQFIPPPQKKLKKLKREQQKPAIRALYVESVRFGYVQLSVKNGEEAVIQMYPNKIVLGSALTRGCAEEILFRHVRATYQAKGSCKVRLQLSHYQGAPGERIDIHFTTKHSRDTLLDHLRATEAGGKILEKEPKWLDDAFLRYDHEMRQHVTPAKSPVQASGEFEPALPMSTPVQPSKSKRLSSMLQGSASESDVQGQDCNERDSEGLSKPSNSVETPRKTKKQLKDSDAGVEIPVTKFHESGTAELKIRRSTRKMTRQIEKPDAMESPANSSDPAPSNDAFRKHWEKPLVYPKVGKKKEEVSVLDRDRLRENNFLNDNLIAFYIRFLQDHLERTNPEVAKRVYFFNSYFFATLTNKGSREINYDAVEKWTRNVDVFSYDYIVVPINQNIHWYVAIICNLPSLGFDPLPKPGVASISTSEQASPRHFTKEVQEILESPEPEAVSPSAKPSEEESAKKKTPGSASPSSEELPQSLETMNLRVEKNAPAKAEHTQRLFPSAKLEAQNEGGAASLVSTPAAGPEDSNPKQSGKNKSKKKRGGVKLDPRQPAIVTFDSLDANRSPTVKALREYICKEAASKRNTEIKNPASEIKGMRAQNIPLQPNYSDCGLYLLAYLESFVRSPDGFISKVLQREMHLEEDWPPLGSGLLRSRMRDFLDQLYLEQSGDKQEGLMVDRQPISFLLGPPRLPREDILEHSKAIHGAETISNPKIKTGADEGVAEEQILQEIEDASDDASTEMPVLVPTAAMPVRVPAERTLEPKPSARQPQLGQSRVPLGELEIQAIPDSQELAAAPSTPEPRFDREAKKKSKVSKDESSTNRREHKRFSTPDKTDPQGLDPDSEHLGQFPRVEVQVPRTPPQKETKRVRQSPRGLNRSI